MARHGIAAGATSLFAAVALGVAGCGPAQVAQGPATQTAVDVAAAMGVEGQALAAMGFDPAELDPSGAASTDAEDPAGAAPSASAAPKGERVKEWRKRHGARVLLRRNTLHGEAVVQTKDGGTRTVVVQRGQVTAIDGDSMTVKSTDGFTLTWAFGEKLRVVERRATVQPTAVKVGTTVGVAGAKDGDRDVARLVLIPLKQK
ncbi:hypothetical protein [Micromonospora mirobrigensis]|uniref:Lipoprotein n=1 Tax=Micromonospora mirobrigensis TaxID=262898 RepID=A0A1C5ANV2_9ACTN|nr:hypothetical protein [Micromonospora mirobrigensis]SCF46915.1 hypothetical protein GA0070564_11521 [Micromonospora mirobrigensis]